jgi:SAM-dependent methyltransferase
MASAAPSARETGLEHLLPLLASKGVTIGLREFHRTVNLVFHNFESAVYDQVHQDMRLSLPRQFCALVDDWLGTGTVPASLRMLDVGCGTGLGTELLSGTEIGPRIAHVDLLDTSAEMLRRCGRRPCMRHLDHKLICGTLDVLPPNSSYDVILACSVLHHIPDLAQFLARIGRLQYPGALFLHLQDLNGDYLDDPQLQRRMREFDRQPARRVPSWAKRLTPKRIAQRFWREVSGRKRPSYIDRVNEELLRSRVIKERLTAEELWSVTDVHVYDGQGIRLSELRAHLAAYELLSVRTYSFFGAMYSDLSPSFRREEDRLISSRSPDGLHVGAIWRRKAGVTD